MARHEPCLSVVTQNQEPSSERHSLAPSVTCRVHRDGNRIQLFGDLRMHDAAKLWQDLRKETEHQSGDIAFDLTNVQAADGGVLALIVALRSELSARGIRAELVGANERVETIVKLYSGHAGVVKNEKRRPEGMVNQIGRASFEVVQESKALIEFLGSVIVAGVALVRHPRAGHWKELPSLCEKTGANALPIVLLINFLVGFVMAFQSAKQLKLYGANVYVADLVGISVTRELAPLMTAIIVCGRSGAAFAAEIGSMKVNEEIDALRTLGLSPFGWLVVPRAVALVLVLPVLTLIADFIGIAGGLVVGIIDLDVTARGYYNETLIAVHGWDLSTGLLKSLAFSLAIALIACQQGFSASGGAEGVGRRTTSAVVASLFTLVLVDSFFTVVFRAMNL